MDKFKIIAFTHRTSDLKDIGKLHIEDAALQERLVHLKNTMGIDELCYLSTCNRVEFLIVTSQKTDRIFLLNFFREFNTFWTKEDCTDAAEMAIVYEGEDALKHLFRVASSVDSLVVGEREIITQVRNAYEKCNEIGLTGDLLRLIIKSTIETAKKVYTDTEIANKPVSVVSLAYRRLKEYNVKMDSRFLIIGAGQTNILMSKFLKNAHCPISIIWIPEISRY